MQIQKAQLNDANRLTDLCIRSKSFWGYSREQIEIWREELTITEAHIQNQEVYMLVDGDLIGFYAFSKISAQKVKLNYLFMEPKYIGKGYGKQFLMNFIDRARNLNYETVTLDADPNAEYFYKKQGFQVVGQLASSIEGRFLPIMELKIK
ncbi:MAG: GNAT family N-acetyltransferase [Bacteroidota bacterium]